MTNADQPAYISKLAAEVAKLLIETQAKRTGHYPPYKEGDLIRDGDYLIPVEDGKLKYEDAMFTPLNILRQLETTK